MNSFLHQSRIATSGFVMFAILSSLILVSFNQGYGSVKTDGESILAALGKKKSSSGFRPQIALAYQRARHRRPVRGRQRQAQQQSIAQQEKRCIIEKEKTRGKLRPSRGGYGERYLRVPGSGVYERRNRRVFGRSNQREPEHVPLLQHVDGASENADLGDVSAICL